MSALTPPSPAASTHPTAPESVTTDRTAPPGAGIGRGTAADRVGPNGARQACSFTTHQLAEAVGGELRGPSEVRIERLAALEDADERTLTFIRSGKFAAKWPHSRAGAALVSKSALTAQVEPTPSRALIVVSDADEAMIRVLGLFMPPAHLPTTGVHPSAVIDPTAVIPASARIGPNCVVGPGTRIGEQCVLHANVTLGGEVEIGPGCELHPGVVVYDRCRIGAKTILHGNVVIGADGFGYRPDPKGRGLIKIPHVGHVEIGSMVEIGAGACIDRGKFGATVIGDGTKIDNLVQIGHNCRIGRGCVICGLSGLAGSVVVGDGSVIAGKAGITDNVTIGKGCTITALAGILSDVPDGTVYGGYPGQPHRQFMRMQVMMKRLAEYGGAMRTLERATHAEESSSPNATKPH